MLNTYNKFNHTHNHNHTININSCSGGIYKTYKESWFKRFNLKSALMNTLSNPEYAKYNPNNDEYVLDTSNFYLYKNYKNVVVLQMVICGDMEVIAEIMYKEDFDKYFNDHGEVKKYEENI